MSQIRGMDVLIKTRRFGEKPKLPVWLWIGFQKGKHHGNSIELEIDRPSASADLRGLVGLEVIVCAKNYSPALMAMWDELKRVCKFCSLWVESWGDNPNECFVFFSRERGEWTF